MVRIRICSHRCVWKFIFSEKDKIVVLYSTYQGQYSPLCQLFYSFVKVGFVSLGTGLDLLKLLSWPYGIRLNETEVYKLSNRYWIHFSVAPFHPFSVLFITYISRCRRRERRRAHRAASSQSSTWRGWTSLIRWWNLTHFIQRCGTVTIFYGSGSDFWKVMVPVLTFEKLWFRFRFRFLLLKSYGSGSSSISKP